METNETNPQEEIQPSFSEPEPEPVRSSTLVCPHCQQEHAIGTLFCPATGKSLSAEPVIEELPQVQEVPAPTPSQGYVPQPPPYSNSNQPPYYPPPAYAAPRPSKDRNIALVLEILPGLFGILGIGWIYSGKVGTGIAWLIGYLIWVGIAVTVSILTGFIACFCTVPINLICVGISAYALNSYTVVSLTSVFSTW